MVASVESMPISQVRQAIGLDLAVGTSIGVLDMIEHERRTLILPEGTAGVVLREVVELLAVAINRGLLTVVTTMDAFGTSRLDVASTNIVGFASSFSNAGEHIFVRIRPKVGTTRMLELAALAGMLPRGRLGGGYVAPTLEKALLEWTIGAFEEALRDLLTQGGLRSCHDRTQGNLKNRVRGRLLAGSWLRNVAKGAPHVIPCEFPSLEFDHHINRVLRWAIHVGITVARSIPDADHIAHRLLQVDRHFAGITVATPQKLLPDPRALPPNLRHYSNALILARLVLESTQLGSDPGAIKSMTIALDMNKV